MHSASKESYGVFTNQYDFSTLPKKTVRPRELVKINSINIVGISDFFMFLLVWILVLKRTDWDIRPAGSGIYEKGTFTGRDFIPGSYPSLCFIPPSLPPLPRYIGAAWVCDMSGKTWPARARAEERLSEKHNHCSALVLTRIEFPFSKSNMGFFLCFCSNSINFSFSLFTIVPWSFVPRGCYLTALINEARRTLAGSHCILFEFWVAFTQDRLLWMFCFLWSNAQHQIIASSRSLWSCFGDEIAMNCLVEIYM